MGKPKDRRRVNTRRYKNLFRQRILTTNYLRHQPCFISDEEYAKFRELEGSHFHLKPEQTIVSNNSIETTPRGRAIAQLREQWAETDVSSGKSVVTGYGVAFISFEWWKSKKRAERFVRMVPRKEARAETVRNKSYMLEHRIVRQAHGKDILDLMLAFLDVKQYYPRAGKIAGARWVFNPEVFKDFRGDEPNNYGLTHAIGLNGKKIKIRNKG